MIKTPNFNLSLPHADSWAHAFTHMYLPTHTHQHTHIHTDTSGHTHTHIHTERPDKEISTLKANS